MTPDELRDRTREALAAKVERVETCPRCGGSGAVKVERPVVPQAELAAIIGVPRTGISAFLSGRQGLMLPATLKLLDWLAALRVGSKP